jgi:protease I
MTDEQNKFGNFTGVTGSHELVKSFPSRSFDNIGDDYKIPEFRSDIPPNWLAGINALFLYADGFEFPEGVVPGHYLENLCGAKVTTASAPWRHQWRQPAGSVVIGEWTNDDRMFLPEISFSSVDVSQYDVVYWPGGCWCPDELRGDGDALRIIREANRLGLLVATICHGGWVLCSASCKAPEGQNSFPTEGIHATGVGSIQEDMRRYGFTVDNDDVVYDAQANLLTATGPKVLGPFCERMGELLKQRLDARA